MLLLTLLYFVTLSVSDEIRKTECQLPSEFFNMLQDYRCIIQDYPDDPYPSGSCVYEGKEKKYYVYCKLGTNYSQDYMTCEGPRYVNFDSVDCFNRTCDPFYLLNCSNGHTYSIPLESDSSVGTIDVLLIIAILLGTGGGLFGCALIGFIFNNRRASRHQADYQLN